jgi:hypothetical protein
LEVVALVTPENAVVDDRMGLEGVVELADRPVHDEAMHGPLDEGGHDDRPDETESDKLKQTHDARQWHGRTVATQG